MHRAYGSRHVDVFVSRHSFANGSCDHKIVIDGTGMRQKLRLAAYQWAVRLPKFRGAGYFQEALRGLLFPRLAAHVDYELRIEIDPWEWAQIDILKNGHTEPETLRLFGEILRPGDVYYDVGAHIGFHALVARHFVGPMGKVVALEPQPYNCARILRNAAVNDFNNIVVVVGVVGDGSGSVLLYDQGIRDKARFSMALESMNDQSQQYQVPMSRLENLMEDRDDKNVRLLKIDVEGYESTVIDGVGLHLSRVENIILEILPECMTNEKTESMLNCLIEREYSLRNVRGAPWKQGTPLLENNLWAARAGADRNYVAAA